MKDKITKKQKDFYKENKRALIAQYLSVRPAHIDPDAVRDLFAPIGYDRSNVQQFQGICKVLVKDIYHEALKSNAGKLRKVIFAAGLPATGKTGHLLKFAKGELIYDGTINDENKFLEFVRAAILLGYAVEVFVYSANPQRAFTSNLKRGDDTGRYVPISHYEKVARTINNRAAFLKAYFKSRVKFRNFEHTKFEARPAPFLPLIINRHELERIAKQHQFPDSQRLQDILK
ncbi:MAG TPA: zeta toxin family protein [Sediminibacterium sp.]|jgi:hypothetical protein